ncbi:hypothetical protein EVAR_46128_1 [Eumeta japonica]|uniref:Uncharacterized protein n=1 Tax=Eumeta variegata TaxID=151549 RepID=A0A4C1XRJ4_EUMVA|nr:hypothetical protein EVAR_46128_1 [Eumeta japonica]
MRPLRSGGVRRTASASYGNRVAGERQAARPRAAKSDCPLVCVMAYLSFFIAFSRGERACYPHESRWSPSPVDTCSTCGVASTVSASCIKMEGWMMWKGVGHQNFHSLDERHATLKSSRLYSVKVRYLGGLADIIFVQPPSGAHHGSTALVLFRFNLS